MKLGIEEETTAEVKGGKFGLEDDMSNEKSNFYAVYIPPIIRSKIKAFANESISGDGNSNAVDGEKESIETCSGETNFENRVFNTEAELVAYVASVQIALATVDAAALPEDIDGPTSETVEATEKQPKVIDLQSIDSMCLNDGGDLERFLNGSLHSSGPFYGVCAQEPELTGTDVLVDSDEQYKPGVYGSSAEAEVVARKLRRRSSRFAKFPTYPDARRFADHGPASTASVSSACGADGVSNSSVQGDTDSCPSPKPESQRGEEQPLPYDMPTRSELLAFRKELEAKKLDAARERIDRNPCYLINAKSGDSPTLLHEGPRYNAMHVATRAGFAEGCRLILAYVSNELYIRLLYPCDLGKLTSVRTDLLQCAFLNMPDKANLRTPLHWAAKLGHLAVVQVLCSQEQCKKNIADKWGETALHLAVSGSHVDIVKQLCSYADVDRELQNLDGATPLELAKSNRAPKDIIAALQESLCYIPLYRDSELMQAHIRQPSTDLGPLLTRSSPDSRGQPEDRFVVNVDRQRLLGTWVDNSPFDMRDPFAPGVTHFGSPSRHFSGQADRLGATPSSFLAAVIGPCPKNVGEKIYTSWKNARTPKALSIKKTDPNKGIERLGRSLARENGVPWQEYWSFLDDCCDLRSPRGLDALEAYLKSKRTTSRRNSLTLPSSSSPSSPVSNNHGPPEWCGGEDINRNLLLKKIQSHNVKDRLSLPKISGLNRVAGFSGSPYSPLQAGNLRSFGSSRRCQNRQAPSNKEDSTNSDHSPKNRRRLPTDGNFQEQSRRRIFSNGTPEDDEPMENSAIDLGGSVNRHYLQSSADSSATLKASSPAGNSFPNRLSGSTPVDDVTNSGTLGASNTYVPHIELDNDAHEPGSNADDDEDAFFDAEDNLSTAVNLDTSFDSEFSMDSHMSTASRDTVMSELANDATAALNIGVSDSLDDARMKDDVTPAAAIIPKAVVDDGNDDPFATPPDSPGDAACYILGPTPSKLDVDALEALGEGIISPPGPSNRPTSSSLAASISVDPIKYPHISAWINSVKFYAENERRHWPSLDSPRFVPRTRPLKRKRLQ